MLDLRGMILDAMNYTQVRKNFAETMNRVCDDHAPVIITRQNERPVVMISLDDYNAIEETIYLLKSPRNAIRLYQALSEIQQEKYIEKDLGDLL